MVDGSATQSCTLNWPTWNSLFCCCSQSRTGSSSSSNNSPSIALFRHLVISLKRKESRNRFKSGRDQKTSHWIRMDVPNNLKLEKCDTVCNSRVKKSTYVCIRGWESRSLQNMHSNSKETSASYWWWAFKGLFAVVGASGWWFPGFWANRDMSPNALLLHNNFTVRKLATELQPRKYEEILGIHSWNHRREVTCTYKGKAHPYLLCFSHWNLKLNGCIECDPVGLCTHDDNIPAIISRNVCMPARPSPVDMVGGLVVVGDLTRLQWSSSTKSVPRHKSCSRQQVGSCSNHDASAKTAEIN